MKKFIYSIAAFLVCAIAAKAQITEQINFNEADIDIPTDAKSAQLCIYDMTGRQVRQLPIDARGATSVSVAAAGMPAGMYLYSLIVDDSLIDTKRMVVGQ